ncbi:methyltransferase type 12, partial [Pseudomonas sp. MWU13-2860]
FDAAAASFDQALSRLRYQGPSWTAAWRAGLSVAPTSLSALDLRCGTGLIGEVLQPWASRLDGVDLSAGMLARAGAKGIYDSLEQAELRAFLRQTDRTYQLIACMDTLPYLGELDALFMLLAERMAPGGLLLFCTGSLEDEEAGDGRLH